MTPVQPADVIAALRNRWGDGWFIWRARSHRDENSDPHTWTGMFVAVCLTPAAGVEATVMENTPADLDSALRQQAVKVAQGIKPLEISSLTELS